MTAQNNLSWKKVFSNLGLKELSSLEFKKNSDKKKLSSCWNENKDPTKKFLAVCFEENLQKNLHVSISLSYIPKKGFCVVLEETIGKHVYIGEYLGVVKKGSISTFFSPYTVSYPTPFSSFRGYVIDAEKKGNFTRFINHSNKANTELKSVLCKDGLIRMIFLSKRSIKKGEELTLNYGTFLPKILWSWKHLF